MQLKASSTGQSRHSVLVRAEQTLPPLPARVRSALAARFARSSASPNASDRISSSGAARPIVSESTASSSSDQRGTHASSPAATRLQASLARPEATAAAAAAFAGVALAVFLGPAGQLVPLVDQSAHAWVAAHTAAEWRLAVGERIISDGPVALGAAACLLLSGAAAAAAPRRAAAPLALCWLFYSAAGGGLGAGPDPWLVASLKGVFARARPSVEIHHSYSFPSGHTAAATFLVGAALVVLLPLAARLMSEGVGRGSSGGGSGSSSGRLPDKVVLPVWGVAIATTACGRVLADAVSAFWAGSAGRCFGCCLAEAYQSLALRAPRPPHPSRQLLSHPIVHQPQHWVSDTLAGAALSIGCVSALAMAVEFVTAADGGSDGSSDGSSDGGNQKD
jgi:membrane-associated phospholipid phosphatase